MADTQGNGAPEAGSGGQYAGPRAVDPAPADTHAHDPDYMTRTRFLSGVAVAGGVVLTAAILVPIVGFAVTDSVQEEEWRWVDVGSLADIAPGATVSIAMVGPAPVSERRVFIRRTNPEDDPTSPDKAGVLTAIWNRCAHLGCPVAGGSGTFVCPCHGGSYDVEGRVTAGPPPRPLDRFQIKVAKDGKDIGTIGTIKLEGEERKELAGSWAPPVGAPSDARVLIGKPFSMDDNLNPYRLHGPGEEVEGVLANLYPF